MMMDVMGGVEVSDQDERRAGAALPLSGHCGLAVISEMKMREKQGSCNEPAFISHPHALSIHIHTHPQSLDST